MKNIILLTAKPRTGKSTCIKNFLDLIGKNNCVGFYTEEIRDSKTGERTGFMIKTLSGESAVLSDVKSKSDLRIGRYGVELANFEKLCLPVLEKAKSADKIIIIDEIGPMQMYSDKYKKLLNELEMVNKKIVGTIFYDSYPFIDDFKKKNNVDLIELTAENRESMPQTLIKKIKLMEK